MEKLFRHSIITFFSEILVFVFGFLGLIIITRALGPDGKGLYSLILLVPSLMLTFGSFGIGAANIYFIGNKKYKVEDIVSNSVVVVIFLSIILIATFWILFQFDFFRNFINSDRIPLSYLWLMVLSIPVSLLLSFFQNVIRGKEKIVDYNLARLLENGLNFLAIFVLLVILKGGVTSAVFAYLLSISGALIFTTYLVRRISKITLKLNYKLLKDSASYGWKVYFANMISFLSYRIDMFLLVFLLSPANSIAQIGFYSVAVSMAEKIFIIPGVFSTVLFPKISSVSSGEANLVTPKIVRHTFAIVLLISIMLAFLAKPIILIFFGSAFLPSIIPFIALLPGIVAFSIGGVIAADLSGRGKPEWAIFTSIACVITNVALNFYLVPKFGILGAAISSSIAYWIDTLIILIVFVKISGRKVSDILFLKKSDLKDYLCILPLLKFKKG